MEWNEEKLNLSFNSKLIHFPQWPPDGSKQSPLLLIVKNKTLFYQRLRHYFWIDMVSHSI